MARFRNFLRIVWLPMALGLSVAYAGEVPTGTVGRVQVGPDGQAVIALAGTYNSRPTCNSTSTFAINYTTTAGLALLNVLQAAALGNAQVRVIGTGACSGASEVVSSVSQLSPVVASTGEYAVCVNGSPGQNGNCSCNTGKDIVPRQIAFNSCRVSTSTGQTCSASSSTTYFSSKATYWYGSCCLCAR